MLSHLESLLGVVNTDAPAVQSGAHAFELVQVHIPVLVGVELVKHRQQVTVPSQVHEQQPELRPRQGILLRTGAWALVGVGARDGDGRGGQERDMEGDKDGDGMRMGLGVCLWLWAVLPSSKIRQHCVSLCDHKGRGWG